ncbi:dihydrofolate reductase [Candidatus Stoquefichus massiliensis]|uniref:dihydrofolate reductase n=1 Tax=Candidatus Stoquefichus massiliensis TaxID=1470350 RepID=UPI00047F0FE0|nr:dihydrofolate reductase [Candidatus Stoquefichus massiliensis]
MISIIVAMDDNQLIGKKESSNGMPWNNKEDLKHFKETTINKTILMGYTTYMAIGRPLPNRKTIVVSFELFDDERVEVRTSLEEVIQEYKDSGEDLFISGGASIYQQSLPLADQLLISRIPGKYEGETYFPDFDEYGFELKETKPFETFDLQIYQRGTK